MPNALLPLQTPNYLPLTLKKEIKIKHVLRWAYTWALHIHKLSNLIIPKLGWECPHKKTVLKSTFIFESIDYLY